MNKNDKKFSLYLESDCVFRQRLLDRIGNNPFIKSSLERNETKEI
jgi:hypothetical protein